MLHCNNSLLVAVDGEPQLLCIAANLTEDQPMSKTALPTFPKLDADPALALYDANVETLLAIQKIVIDLGRTVASRQVAYFKDAQAKAEAALKGGFDARKQPQAYVDEAKAAVEKVVADTKETVELGLKAQNEVAGLVTRRVKANLSQATATAA
jgi:hypothetical protein